MVPEIALNTELKIICKPYQIIFFVVQLIQKNKENSRDIWNKELNLVR